MPKLLTWRDHWSLQIDILDRDHRNLIERLGDICLRFCPEAHAKPGLAADAGHPAPGQSALAEALTGLGQQVREHFRREEAFMHAIGYDRVAEHEGEHAALMAAYTKMLTAWEDRELVVFDALTQERVRHWLMDHVLGSDRSFADAYFRLCGQEIPRDMAG
jgi:hemerythrin